MGVQGDILKARRQMRAAPAEAVATCAAILERYPANRAARQALLSLEGPALTAFDAQIARLLARERWDDALALLRPLRRLRPDDPRLAPREAVALSESGRPDEAIALLDPLLARFPDHARLLGALSIAQAALGRGEDAVETLARAVAAAPADAAVLTLYAAKLRILGRMEEARRAIERAVSQPGTDAKTWLHASELLDFNNRPDLLAGLHRTAERGDLAETAEADLCFAAANVAFALDQPDSAFAHLNRANAIVAGYRRCNFEKGAHEIARIAQALADRPVADASPGNGPRIVFVVGMPRSGTTLIERILDAHPRAQGLGELHALGDICSGLRRRGTAWGPADLAEIAAQYRADIARRAAPGTELIIDKMPSNAFRASLALAALPEAQVLDMRRDPVAVAFSSWRRHYASANAFAYTVEGLAAQARLTRRAVADAAALFPGRVRHVLYEALVENAEDEIGAILDWIGLDTHPRCINFGGAEGAVKTASAAQVRRRIYKGSSEAWRRYERWLAPIVDIHRDLSADHAAALSACRVHSPPA